MFLYKAEINYQIAPVATVVDMRQDAIFFG